MTLMTNRRATTVPINHDRGAPGTAGLGGAEGRQDDGKPVIFRGVEAEVLHGSI